MTTYGRTGPRFQDKVVIVTGGGSGLGRAAALAFAREGAIVAVADLNDTGGNDTVATIRAEGGRANFYRADVNQAEDVDALVAETVKSRGRLDVYFSNAGIVDDFLPCLEISNEVWNKVVGVNLSGCFYGARAALPHLIERKGNIVMTASGAAYRGMAGGVAYTSAKAGITGLVNQLACEYGGHGVRVNGVAPGAFRTNIAPARISDPATDQWIKVATPLGRWGEPEELASAVLFLASDEASYITGTMLRVDGGFLSK